MKMLYTQKPRPTVKPLVASNSSTSCEIPGLSSDSQRTSTSSNMHATKKMFDPEFTSFTGVPRRFDDDHQRSVLRVCSGHGISLDERKRLRDERAQEKKEKKHKVEEVLPSSEEITSVVFKLFTNYEFITLVDVMRCMGLSQESNKAKTAVKNALRHLAVYEASGPNKRKYKMRDEWKIRRRVQEEEKKDVDDDINWESEEKIDGN